MTSLPLPTASKNDIRQAQLIVIDIQQKLGDAMPGKVLNRVLLNTELLCRSAAQLDVPVLCTEQYPAGLGDTHASVAAALPANTPVIEKRTFSCCATDSFNRTLSSSRNQVVLLGMEAHVCVLQTALDLATAGQQVFVVEDAICSRRLENYQNALDRMRQADIAVVSAESVVFEWLEGADNPNFKAIQPLLR